MASRVSAFLGAVAVVGLVGGLAAPAHAGKQGKPDHAGPPARETVSIVGSGEPVVVCGDREIRFLSGDLATRFRALPGERFRGGFVLRDVLASDGETTFRVRGSARFAAKKNSFTFAVHLVLIGPGGDVETVRSVETFRADGEEMPPQERGSCTLRFDEGEMPEEEMPAEGEGP